MSQRYKKIKRGGQRQTFQFLISEIRDRGIDGEDERGPQAAPETLKTVLLNDSLEGGDDAGPPAGGSLDPGADDSNGNGHEAIHGGSIDSKQQLLQ